MTTTPLPVTDFSQIHIGTGGTFSPSGKFSSVAADIDALFAYLSEKDTDTLILYFHGGLVPEASGMAATAVITQHFSRMEEKRHAVSFVWETGPAEILLEQLDKAAMQVKSGLYKELINFVIKLVAGKLGKVPDAKGNGVYLSDEAIEEEKTKEAPFEELDTHDGTKGGSPLADAEADEDVERAQLEMESRILVMSSASDELLAALEEEAAMEEGKGFLSLGLIKLVAETAFQVLRRFRRHTHHDFYPTITEELFRKLGVGAAGTWGWNAIKQKAADMFADNTGLSGTGLHAGRYFLERLQAHYAASMQQNKPFSIHLIGHSAGSIVICHLLRQAMRSYPDLRFKLVALLAPACRTDLFMETIPAAREQGCYQQLRLFTMREENEKKDHCIPYVYTHSLLYLVSGLFEADTSGEPAPDTRILGLHEQFRSEGRYADDPLLQSLKTFLQEHCTVILSDDIDNPEINRRCSALKHGDFDDNELTLTSILLSI
ncbi:hypothetical protein F0L74_27155 [Chitinophaga agrisoli]|uniref:Alpha/beta hydrolase family protein DUF900 n=1 Tax=Chitinophaga agrisoli TaxID=2607653 RepID=A0A5B2VNU5_9BACT|nr:hypothetical protein [Chitinophaga agrisoli]KAA2239867.1 hypothetical protein F0L74_27155 [Chitinophaga agrisoli]